MTPAELKSIRESLPHLRNIPEEGVGRPSSGGNGWTQRTFANALGVPVRTYEKYESASGVVPEPIARLARLFAKAAEAGIESK